MQYGLKKDSTERIMKGIHKVSEKIEELKQEKEKQEKDSTYSKLSVGYIDIQLDKSEMALTILSHIQESLENFDFVLLDKEEYDYVSGYIPEQ